MRNQHINTRMYEIPVDLIQYQTSIQYGIPTQTETVIVSNIMCSIKDVVSKNETNPSRNYIATKSLVFQNPPFELDPLTMKIRLQDKIWTIQNVNNDFITRGDVQVTITYEADDDATTNTGETANG